MNDCAADRSRCFREGVLPAWSDHEALQALSRFHRSEEQGRVAMLLPAAQAWASGTLLPRPDSGVVLYLAPSMLAAPEWRSEVQAETARQATLLREVLGNPFRLTVADETWLAWNGGTVRRLAALIYEEKRWDELPILADALEDAGCRDEAILRHQREPGTHILGCWALDVLLGNL